MDESVTRSLKRRLETSLHAIIAELERTTGLSSQWNGQIEVVSATDRAFGGKTFTCLIRIRSGVAANDLCWPTLLHEVFHCFSVGRNADATLNYPGYEEGVVEQCQRLFRAELLTLLGVEIASASLVDRDANSAYTEYVIALEAMRFALGEAESKTFYLDLLGMPLEQREAFLREQAQQSHHWHKADFRRQWRRWERVLRGEDN